jgi:glutamate/aspartate transport system permease protein
MAFNLDIFCKSTLEDTYSSACFGEKFKWLFHQGDVDPTYLDWLISAWGWTITVAIISLFLAMFFGIIIGTLRTLETQKDRNKLWISCIVFLSNTWVEIFRNIPVLVQVFLWYHVIPVFLPILKTCPSFLLVSFALGFFTSARIAEQVKAGITSLPKGQRMASKALGLSVTQTYRYVLLPMALRVIIPPMTSEAMNIVKNSAVAFAVSVSELTLFAMQTQEETSRGIEMYLAVTLLYSLTALMVNRLMNWIERTTQIPGYLNSLKIEKLV